MPAGSGTEDYILIASGPSQDAPFLREWKDFKDNLRSIIKNQPGWTNVKPGQRRGDREAWCRLDGIGDAEAAYSMQSLLATILDIANFASRLLYPGQRNISSYLRNIPKQWRLSTHEVSETRMQIKHFVKENCKMPPRSLVQQPDTQLVFLLHFLPLTFEDCTDIGLWP